MSSEEEIPLHRQADIIDESDFNQIRPSVDPSGFEDDGDYRPFEIPDYLGANYPSPTEEIPMSDNRPSSGPSVEGVD